MGVSGGDVLAVGEPVLIDAGMQLIAIDGFHVAATVGLDVPTCFGIACRLFVFTFPGAGSHDPNRSGIYHLYGPFGHVYVLCLKLLAHFAQQDFPQIMFDKFLPVQHGLGPVQGRIQISSATIDLKAAISSAMASAGVLHPRVFLGRLFMRFATSFSRV